MRPGRPAPYRPTEAGASKPIAVGCKADRVEGNPLRLLDATDLVNSQGRLERAESLEAEKCGWTLELGNAYG